LKTVRHTSTHLSPYLKPQGTLLCYHNEIKKTITGRLCRPAFLSISFII